MFNVMSAFCLSWRVINELTVSYSRRYLRIEEIVKTSGIQQIMKTYYTPGKVLGTQWGWVGCDPSLVSWSPQCGGSSSSRPPVQSRPVSWTGHFSLAMDYLDPISTMGPGSQISGRQMLLRNQNIEARGWGLTAREWKNLGIWILPHRCPGLEKNAAGKTGWQGCNRKGKWASDRN